MAHPAATGAPSARGGTGGATAIAVALLAFWGGACAAAVRDDSRASVPVASARVAAGPVGDAPGSGSATPNPAMPVPTFGHGRAVLLPGVGTVDPRVVVDVGAEPWRAVVRVQTGLGGRCTGFLVAPSVAITAAHCVTSPLTGRVLSPGDVHVLSGYHDGQYDGAAVATAVRPAPGFDPAREDATAGADWATVSLSAPLGKGRVLRLAESEPGPGTVVALGGYGQDRAERLVADPRCLVLGPARDGEGRPLLRHGCAATRGTSGGPLLWSGPGGWRVVGVEVAADLRGVGGIAVPLRATGG